MSCLAINCELDQVDTEIELHSVAAGARFFSSAYCRIPSGCFGRFFRLPGRVMGGFSHCRRCSWIEWSSIA